MVSGKTGSIRLILAENRGYGRQTIQPQALCPTWAKVSKCLPSTILRNINDLIENEHLKNHRRA